MEKGTIDEKQQRYKKSLKCELNNIFECLNEWIVTNLITNKNDEVHDDELVKDILQGMESRMPEKIAKGNYGVMRTDDPSTDGVLYSGVEFQCLHLPRECSYERM